MAAINDTLSAKAILKQVVKQVRIAWVAKRAGNSAFQPTACVTTLANCAEDFATMAAESFKSRGHPATSKLYKSFKAKGPYRSGSKVTMQVMALDYYKFVNQGSKAPLRAKIGKKILGNTKAGRLYSLASKKRGKNSEGFFDEVVAIGGAYTADSLQEAFVQDIINSLEQF
ncbi:hypothetical protein [Mucilaginibacter pedocola]|uniref:Uncharacterized protein n=1 Tax=Mucilaginibacter pedocola TaxID=1792845 RepID=A0A1S9P868_9SPHI|nr:hypothetical protein [Mucilaginibacter pedocola]OOQ57151.1 hypothetical protein BC343_16660 [Mucilaginibacter pedocola]